MSNFRAPDLSQPTLSAGKPLRIGIWLAQVVAAALFCMSGIMKLTTPIPELSAMMPWTGELSPTFVRLIGLIDLAGGLGLILPSLTCILPQLTVLAALCCVVLQALAAGFHSFRGEFEILPLNALLLGLAIFIFWGRSKKAPIAPCS
ncbi:DoxX family protein [Agrobacterium rhizogenes]|uniref:DoxX family protein n=1 Tax=Rhizobium rhizogenes NBRC 13257 TaxID=1220581 RepID=A0AA87QEA2_RHIRH|nr:DoxX family protein [Rhizobium rhizogenes]NTF59273.1 DoxX family protein [Rhizobium rhizogenes]NTF78857.1 DoxX family protein [Rhizobium rhizogenes]NTF98417.1 DoxX family protein [Rhizobium rhizogenes]NTG64596.1 DoxX family protein [Rhizobium rhizogenes]NTG71179.1 DoxX family protein [Rhizobium rhizogenes]